MRRWIAATLTASAMSMALASPAVAEVKKADPVGALKKQFVAGHGVTFTEKTRTWVGREEYAGATREGKVEFGAKGVVGVESARTPVLTPKLRKQLKEVAADSPEAADAVDMLTEKVWMVGKGNRLYFNGGLYSTLLPEEKSWLTTTGPAAAAAYGDQVINVFEPTTLKTLLATAKSRKGDQYRGTITFARLYKLSPMFKGAKLYGKAPKASISWRITLDANQLVKRVAIDWSIPVTKKETLRSSTETRYSGWGSEMSVTAPSEDESIDIKDLPKNGFRPPAVDRNYVDVPPDDEGKVDQ